MFSVLGGVRRRLRAVAVAMANTLLLPAQAVAGGDVNCWGGGQLYTLGESTNTQYHFVHGLGTTSNLGSGERDHHWGYRTATYEWDVFGNGILWENAACPS